MKFGFANLNFCNVKVQLVRDEKISRFDYPISGPKDVYRLIGDEMRKQDREHLLVIYLTGRNKVIGIENVAIGSLESIHIDPREVFKGAILANAASIIVAHNHPSGEEIPSDRDKLYTSRLVEVGGLIGIDVIDHIIIGDNYFSFYKAGLLKESNVAYQ